MTEDEAFPVERGEPPEARPRPRQWWVAGVALAVAGVLLATLVPGLLPREKTGSGTGFAITPHGHVLTAAHVVQGATEVTVYWAGRGYRATTVAVSVEHDLSLLLLEDAPPIPPVALASDRPAVGDPVMAIGHPTGAVQLAFLSTHVAGVGWWAVGPEGTVLRDLIATADPFRRGYSGAPLANGAGEVVGVVTGSVTSQSGRKFGFAASIGQAVDWLTRRGMALPLSSRRPSFELREGEIGTLLAPSVVRVEARFPPGSP